MTTRTNLPNGWAATVSTTSVTPDERHTLERTGRINGNTIAYTYNGEAYVNMQHNQQYDKYRGHIVFSTSGEVITHELDSKFDRGLEHSVDMIRSLCMPVRAAHL